MDNESKASNAQPRQDSSARRNHSSKAKNQVYLITGASESVAADVRRKNRMYAVTIGVRIASLFVVLMTDGWLQIAIFVIGMLAPWFGVQIANTIRQVQDRSIEVVPPQQAALTEAKQRSEDNDGDTFIVGDVVDDEDTPDSTTPSAESDAEATVFDENREHHDDTGS